MSYRISEEVDLFIGHNEYTLSVERSNGKHFIHLTASDLHRMFAVIQEEKRDRHGPPPIYHGMVKPSDVYIDEAYGRDRTATGIRSVLEEPSILPRRAFKGGDWR